MQSNLTITGDNIRIKPSIMVLLVVMLSFIFVCLRFNTVRVGNYVDDAKYLILAESLAQGKGLRNIHEVGEPIESAFPLGWPLLLSPIVYFFPSNLVAPRILSTLFWLASIPLGIRIARRFLPAEFILFFSVWFGLNAFMIGYAGTVMSEPAYLFFSLLSLNLYFGWEEQESWPYKLLYFCLMIICLIMTLLIRSVGITLSLGVAAALVLKASRRVRTALSIKWLVFSGVVIIGAIILLIGVLIASPDFYLFSSRYQGHFSYITNNFVHYLEVWQHLQALDFGKMANVLFPITNLSLNNWPFVDNSFGLISFFLLMIIIIGLLRGLFPLRKAGPVPFYTLGMLAIFYLWTVYIGRVQQRQLFPLIPFLSIYFIVGLEWVLKIIASRFGKTPHAFVRPGIQSVIAFCVVLAFGANVAKWIDPPHADFDDISVGPTWIRENSPPDTLYITVDAGPTYIYSHRKVMGFRDDYDYIEELESVDVWEQKIEDAEVDLILIQTHIQANWAETPINTFMYSELMPMLNSKPEAYEIIFEDPSEHVVIYKVLSNAKW